MKRHLLLVARIAVAAAAVFWLFRSGHLDLGDPGRLLASWPWLFAALLCFFGEVLLGSIRWLLLVRAQGVSFRVRDACELTLIGWFFNQLMLGTTGGDLYRAYAVASERPGRRIEAALSVFVDRLLGFVTLLLVSLFALIHWSWTRSDTSLVSIALFLAAALAACVLGLLAAARLAGRTRLRGLLLRIDEAVRIYGSRPATLLAGLAASLLIQALTIAMNLCLARALGADRLDWQSFILLVPVAHAAMAVPLNPPGAIGTGELIYAELFSLTGFTQGALVCLLQRVVLLVGSLPGAVLFVLRGGGGAGLYRLHRAGQRPELRS